jgi:hypothetical protein
MKPKGTSYHDWEDRSAGLYSFQIGAMLGWVRRRWVETPAHDVFMMGALLSNVEFERCLGSV